VHVSCGARQWVHRKDRSSLPPAGAWLGVTDRPTERRLRHGSAEAVAVLHESRDLGRQVGAHITLEVCPGLGTIARFRTGRCCRSVPRSRPGLWPACQRVPARNSSSPWDRSGPRVSEQCAELVLRGSARQVRLHVRPWTPRWPPGEALGIVPTPHSGYFGGIRMPPSTRIVSPFM
jgi:hypothetical protein